MESLRCFCGIEVAGADEDAFFLAMREHLDQAHHWQPSDEKLRGMLREVLAQQALMAPWDGTLLPVPARVDIHPLTPDRLRDFLQFFDREGFRDNPSGRRVIVWRRIPPNWLESGRREKRRGTARRRAL